MQKITFSILFLATHVCLALEPQALTNAVNGVIEFLGAMHGCDKFMKGAIEYNGWSSRDCAEILESAELTLRGSSISDSSYRRQNAISLLGQFGGTNAISHLVSIMQQDEGVFKFYAGQGYLRIAAEHPFSDWEVPLKEEILRSPSCGGSFSWSIYKQCSDDLKFAGPSEVYRHNLLRFLLDQTAVEQGERAMLDEILCREVPKWRASPQRLANAERMIREHSNDAGAVSFFEGVRADALSAGALAREQNPDGRSSGTPADSPNQGGNTKDAADPWADLLDDLPEKQPWTPPDGMVPAS